MSTQIQNAAFGTQHPVGFGSDVSKRQDDASPILPSGWWMAPFLLTGTMFWLWFIPVLSNTVI